MSEEPSSETKPEKKPRRKRRGCLIALLCTLIVLGGAYTAYRLILKARIRSELEALEQAGYPTTLQALNYYYAPVYRDNGAFLLLAAGQELKSAEEVLDKFELEPRHLKVGGMNIPDSRGDWSRRWEYWDNEVTQPGRRSRIPEQAKAAVLAHLSNNRRALELLHMAADMREFRYPGKPDPDFGGGYFASLRMAVRVAGLAAVVRAEEGDSDGAVRELKGALCAGESLATMPALLAQLVRYSCAHVSMLYCQGVVNRIQMTDAQLSELVGKLREAEDAAGLTRGLAGDLCSISHEFRLGFEPALSEDFLERTKERIWHWAWLASGLCDLNHLEYLRLMRDAVKISGGPSVPSMLEEMEALQNRADGLPFMYRGARSFVPALAGCARRHAGSLAQLRTARGALAVERYRIANGRLPEKLDDLVPEFMGAIPVDPFDGRPLRYKKLEKGYVVYSVGTDRADDGGKEGDGLEEGSDITFIVER